MKKKSKPHVDQSAKKAQRLLRRANKSIARAAELVADAAALLIKSGKKK